MADFLGNLLVRIGLDTSAFNKGVDQSQTRLTRFSRSATQAGQTVTRSVTLPLGLLAAAAVKATSDLEESANAVNVVFGDAAQTIFDFGETASESVGLSESAFNELVTVTGALLKQSGQDIDTVADSTINLTQRAADLASVFNTDVSDALTALNAGLRGETEPARRFAINISDAAVVAEALASGLVDTADQITENIKVQARYNIILGDSEDVAGDFANTSDSLANRTRILRAEVTDLAAELGQTLVPIVQNLLDVADRAVTSFGELDENTRQTIVTLGIIAAAIGPALRVIGGLTRGIGLARTAVQGLGRAISFLAANPIVALVAGLGAAATALVVLRRRAREAANATATVGRRTNDAAFELMELFNDFISGRGTIESYGNALDRVTDRYDVNRIEVLNLLEAQNSLTEEYLRALNVTDDEILAIQAESDELRELQERIRQTAQEQQDANQGLTDAQKLYIAVREELIQQNATIRETARAYEQIGEEYDTVAERSNALQGAIDTLIEQGFRAEGGAIQALITEFGNFEEESVSLIQIVEDQIQAVNRAEEVYRDLNIQYDAATERSAIVQDAINQLIEEGHSLQSQAVQELIDQYGQYITNTDNATLSLEEQLDVIERTSEAYRDANIEYDIAARRADAVQGAIDNLIEQGYDPQSEAIQQVIADYGEYIDVANAARQETNEFIGIIQNNLTNTLETLGRTLVDESDSWEAFEDAAKSAIAAVIRGLGQQAVVQAAAAFVPGLTFNPIAGAGYTAAAALAFTTAGIVEALQDGGVVQPNRGNRLFQMAEAGVPELALPLSSPAIDPFADAIARRINTQQTINNNQSVQVNSLFALGNQSEIRQAAQTLFPALEAEAQRRGITLGGRG